MSTHLHSKNIKGETRRGVPDQEPELRRRGWICPDITTHTIFLLVRGQLNAGGMEAGYIFVCVMYFDTNVCSNTMASTQVQLLHLLLIVIICSNSGSMRVSAAH